MVDFQRRLQENDLRFQSTQLVFPYKANQLKASEGRGR